MAQLLWPQPVRAQPHRGAGFALGVEPLGLQFQLGAGRKRDEELLLEIIDADLTRASVKFFVIPNVTAYRAGLTFKLLPLLFPKLQSYHMLIGKAGCVKTVPAIPSPRAASPSRPGIWLGCSTASRRCCKSSSCSRSSTSPPRRMALVGRLLAAWLFHVLHSAGARAPRGRRDQH